MHFSLITVPQTEWRSGPSPASHQLDDPWTLSSLSLQWRMGEHWQHPSSGFINSMHWPNWMIYMKRLWKLWGAIPMYVIIIFLTKFVILSVNEILICSSNTLLWLCLSYTYENAWVYPAGNVSYGVCLFLILWPQFKIDFRQLKKTHVLYQDTISLKILRQWEGFSF